EEFVAKNTNNSTDILESTEQVPKQYFPPCIQNILKPLQDGRKRSMFVLVNFLHSIGWNHDQIEELLKIWNKQQSQPLSESLITGQVRYHKQMNKKNLPPNCFNKQYYMELGFCKPDAFCPRIKNPASYAVLKQRAMAQEVNAQKKEEEKKVKKELKAKKIAKPKKEKTVKKEEGESAKEELPKKDT
ncbi:MAG: hypothetical protein Q7K43_01880, partial [Candidatus Woesearchaeota archaeon]|nr:hypothetical protein [Candidatus Woesearchaeota archaeon]